MDKFADRLGRIGTWCSNNKYLSAIKNAFQIYMPATIAGSVCVLWNNVLINDNVVNGNAQGLGAVFKPIMVLEPFNEVFSAIQFATLSCMSLGIVIIVAQEIGKQNGEVGVFPAILGLLSWMAITPTKIVLEGFTNNSGDVAVVEGFVSDYLGATGLFTALIVGIVSLEIYNLFRKMDGLKIKMPSQVPTGVSRSFEVLIPSFLTLLVIATIGWGVKMISGVYLNDIVKSSIQNPLQKVIGNNILALIFLQIIVSLFWLIGMHGDNMVGAVRDPLLKTLLYSNTALYQGKATDITEYSKINIAMNGMFAGAGGTGMTMGLVIAIFIFSKREDNRAIAKISIAPSLFNINETVTFGLPLVLNPILGIAFIIVPCIGLLVGWFLMSIEFCPPAVLEVPWTTPPLLYGFLATGGKIMGAVSQGIVLLLSIAIYTPFLMAFEKYQNKLEKEV